MLYCLFDTSRFFLCWWDVPVWHRLTGHIIWAQLWRFFVFSVCCFDIHTSANSHISTRLTTDAHYKTQLTGIHPTKTQLRSNVCPSQSCSLVLALLCLDPIQNWDCSFVSHSTSWNGTKGAKGGAAEFTLSPQRPLELPVRLDMTNSFGKVERQPGVWFIKPPPPLQSLWMELSCSSFPSCALFVGLLRHSSVEFVELHCYSLTSVAEPRE